MKRCIYLLLGTIIGGLLFVGCGSHPNTATVTDRPPSAASVEETEVEALAESKELSSGVYIISDFDMANETIELFSAESYRIERFSYNLTTKFSDKFGNSSSWSNFTIGTPVEIGERLPSSGALSEIRISDKAWIYDGVKDFSYDKERDIFVIDGSNYRITQNTRTYSDSEEIRMSDISDSDILKVVGIDKTILSISVVTGHGYIHVYNTELFNNSLMFVGNKIVTMVYGENTIEVPEGSYKITVANDGWGGSGEYEVVRNEITEVDLDVIKGDGPKYCDLSFLITVPETYVYLDGKLIDTNEAVQVRYGAHSLVVKCDGYVSWQKTLVVNSSSATIELALEEESTSNSSTTATTEAGNSGEGTAGSSSSSDTNSSSSSSSSQSKSDDYDYETDYLSTVSDILNSILGK